ncbi:MAG: HAMP domain-containing protein [Alphaproteobacteria bacterium]|nr:HAMP domain-containing protein [Alphaproteobacteria bacterium]
MQKSPTQITEKRNQNRPEDDGAIGLGFMLSNPLSNRTGYKKRRRFIPSTLTIRILMINLLAPVLLVVGTLYIDEYQEGLVASELRTLQMQSNFIADALAITRTNRTSKPSTSINIKTINELTNKITAFSNVHVRIFDKQGNVITDNENNLHWTKKTKTNPENTLSISKVALYVYNDAMRSLVGGKKLDEYISNPYMHAKDYNEVSSALHKGISFSAIRNNETFGTVLTVARPIVHDNKIVAAIMLATTTQNIKQGLTSLQIAVFRLFIVALITSIVLSLYLAKTITRPIQKLASAANKIRKGKGRETQIPDLSNRYDEIGDLSSSLSSMTSALWMRLDVMETFAADVTHELKNPITSLSSAVETLKRIKSPEKREKLIGIIKHDTERMNRLITDISSLSKLDSELSRSKLKSVKLMDLMEDMLKNYNLRNIDYRDYLEEQELNEPTKNKDKNDYDHPITIVQDFSGAVYGRIIGEETLLKQVFQNIIDNAISFSPPNGHVFIRVGGGKFVIVDIEDEGCGIIKGKEEHIFERFFSERPKSEGFGKHSGLGLSICKRILDGLGGYIIAKNRTSLEIETEETKTKEETTNTDNHKDEILGARFSVFLKRTE